MSKSTENLAIVYDDVTITLAALGAGAAIGGSSKIDSSRENGFRIMKTEYFVDFYGKTVSEGPIVVGMACNHNATEIEEAIEADPQNNLLGNEANSRPLRPIWPLEMISYSESAKDGVNIDPKSFTPRWSCPEGSGVTWFAYNMGPQLTTGTIIRIFAKHYGVWLRD